MKFLLAIKDTSIKSKNILDIGCKIAEGFSADLTICYVGKKSKALIESEISLTRLSLAEWNIYHPGIEVLEWAFNILKDKGFLKNINFNLDNLTEIQNRIRLVLPKTKGYQIRLVLREGDLLSELNQEVKYGEFDIAILGSPKKKRLIQNIAQFLDTSIFFIKNFRPNWNYKILLCVDDSRATKRAVILSTRLAKQFNANISLITVSKTSSFGKGYQNAHHWAEKYINRIDIPFDSKLLHGDPINVFINEANDDHIIIMGKAKGSEISKFVFGSKPINTAKQSNCPILLVN